VSHQRGHVDRSLVDDSSVDRLLGELRDGPVALSAQTQLEARRRRVVPALRAQVGKIPHVRRRARFVRALALSSTVGAGLLGVWLLSLRESARADRVLIEARDSGAVVSRGTDSDTRSEEVLEGSLRVEAQGELEVSKRASLTTSLGVKVELAERTRVGLGQLALQEDISELRLVSGSVDCSVPPLGRARTFSVVTGDTRVIVHGTRFSVEARGAEPSKACVRVSEGLVEVRHASLSVMLRPGERWGCAAEPTEAQPSVEGTTEPAPAGVDAVVRPAVAAQRKPKDTARSARQPGPVPRPARGTLAEETRLMSAALSAERRGDLSAAGNHYAEIVEEYPDSPLAPEARRGLARVR